MNPNETISLQVKDATTVAAYRRLKIGASARVEPAGASDTWIGTNLQDVDSTVVGRNISSVQLKKNGIHYATYGTSTALSAGDEIVGAAGGKITKGAASPIGVALESASADGDIIRVLYY
jgi:hypothetical protein